MIKKEASHDENKTLPILGTIRTRHYIIHKDIEISKGILIYCLYYHKRFSENAWKQICFIRITKTYHRSPESVMGVSAHAISSQVLLHQVRFLYVPVEVVRRYRARHGNFDQVHFLLVQMSLADQHWD
jgi:hypothetical protein